MMKRYLFLLVIFYFLFFTPSAHAAILYSQAANQDVFEGQTFAVDWFLDTEGKSINSLDLKINFSKDTLQAIDASTGNSLVNLWIQNPTIDNNQGSISLVGGIANGANDNQVPIFHAVFKALKSGTASITMDPSSQILLNDGHGTSEQLKFKDELFNVYPAQFIPIQITSVTHPDQNSWYSNKDVEIKFNPKEGTDYSFSFSSNIEIIPDDKKMEVPSVISYPDRPDGIYYFKLNSKVGPSDWQEAGIYRVQIDTTAPESFEPVIGSDLSIFHGNSFVSFSTLDKTSGISHYTIKVGTFGKTITAQSPYELRKPWIGDNVTITAYDKAGNSRVVIMKWPGLISETEFKLILIFIGLTAIVVNLIVAKQIRKTSEK